ncbi:DNA polymerase III subunit beta [Sporolituus thermophilus]|uniref:Beta sliding clamp n=1 Tax=Sporolituus thermophilus DSM 23256 TaxID=1123285 RepID=A0A1G7LX38_9FIRM|nr:DNA polymerase III subunit beta [Sporolituus thermophilus]SDF54075.1 DNA polymerase-3 subunit beta [Sporolituus thermophilus DSM 23256]
MKITCRKDLLNHAVQTVQKAVATKNPLPILTGIYLAAQDNRLQLQATDYEIGISCSIEAQVEKPGAIVLSGRYFQELVRRLPGETVEIASNTEDRTIRIASASAQFNLLSLPAEEFPVLKPLSSDQSFTVKDNILRELIKKTVFACATDEARPIFTGGLLEADELGIRMVATNTHRLALKKDVLDAFGQPGINSKVKMIIPAKFLAEVARLLVSEVPMDVKVSWHKNQVSFEFDNVYIIARIIEGQFPDYNKVIPTNFATVAEINTDQFGAAVERVALLAKDGDYNIIKFSFKPDHIIITSNNPDVGKACEMVGATMTGNEIDIAFNARYVLDIIKNIDSELLRFSLNTPLSPACIKPVDDENYTYVITPVRTS